jgi:UDP-N-acetylglucosamine 3-dehydrogenase
MSEQKNWTAAVIGLGFIGAGDPVSGDAIGQKVANLDGTHAAALAAHPRVRLVAGSSRDEGRRRRFAARQGDVRTYADWRDLLAAEKPDIVSLATNSPFHADIGAACAEAGVKAVLVEKPVATNLPDAEKILAACRRHNTLLAVNHSRRWHPLWQTAAAALRDGVIGDIGQAAAHWQSGRLGNIGTHLFDALRLLLARNAVAVSGTLDSTVPRDCRGDQFHDPGGWGTIAFEGGVRAFINAPGVSKLPLAVRVTGSEGELVIHGQDILLAPWKDAPRKLDYPADGSNSLTRAVADLVTCLESDGRPRCTGEDGLAALEIIIGFHASSRRNGQWIPLPLAGEDRSIDVPIG